MDTIKKPRRVDSDEGTRLLPDYLENIAGDVYMAVTEFEGENYVHIWKFFTDRMAICERKNKE